MAKQLIITCDICTKKHTGYNIPENWFEFYYEYDGKELEFTTCSIKCYAKQIVNCLSWANQHHNVKIAGMHREFARRLVEGLQYTASEFAPPIGSIESIVASNFDDTHIKPTISKPTQLSIPTFPSPQREAPKEARIRNDRYFTPDQKEFFKEYTKIEGMIQEFYRKFPESNKSKGCVYASWYATHHPKKTAKQQLPTGQQPQQEIEEIQYPEPQQFIA